MKVAFLSYSFGTETSGIGKYSWYLVNGLRELDIEVDVFTTNIHIKGFGPPLFYIGNIFKKFKQYDLIHSNEGAGVFLNHPCMIETYHHDYKQTNDFNSLMFNSLEDFQCQKVAHIIVPSFLTKKRLLRHGVEESKISVILHGVDPTVFRPKNKSRDAVRAKLGISNSFVVINVGQLIRRKKQTDILKVLHNLPNTVLILVGKGDEESKLKALASKLGINLIHFKHIPESFLVDLYNAADVYVHTAVLEGFGLSVVEAMSCGLPIVAYDTSDFSEIIGNAGYVLEQGDTKMLQEKILLLQQNEALRKSLGAEALRQCNNFTWNKSALKHSHVYKEILNT